MFFARSLGFGERVEVGSSLVLPAHQITISSRISSPATTAPGNLVAETFRRVPPRPRDPGILGPSPDKGEVNGDSSPPSPVCAATGTSLSFHLDSLFSHFWTAARVPPDLPSSDSFGWWLGKAGGDLRSFAQVVASPPKSKIPARTAPPSKPMGDRGGRFGGRRGGSGGGGGGRNPSVGHQDRPLACNNVWQRDPPVGSGGSQTGSGSERRSEEHTSDSSHPV